MSGSPRSDPVLAKRELRARIRAARGATTAEERAATGLALLAVARLEGLLDSPVAGYLPQPGEPDVLPLMAAAPLALAPIPEPGRQLAWARADGPTKRHARLPVDVPVGSALGRGATALAAAGVRTILVPALAVSLDGTRLGQGGGYYDTLLAEVAGMAGGQWAPRVLCVVHQLEVLPAGGIPAQDHDTPVAAALTPEGIRRLGTPTQPAS